MGAGKTTLINKLIDLHFNCVTEPARAILAEQRAVGGHGVPDHDPQLFVDLLLARAVQQFTEMRDNTQPVIFDRGIADNIAYTKLFDLNINKAVSAAQRYRYHPTVFFLNAWEEIYQQDAERKMTFAAANSFGAELKLIYQDLGYTVVDVPFATPDERAVFITQHLAKIHHIN